MTIQEAAEKYKESRDEKAFNVIYDYIGRVNASFAYNYKQANTKDMVHDVGVIIIEKIDSYDNNKATFATWLSKVVTNKYNRMYAVNKRTANDVDVEADTRTTGKIVVTESYTPDYDYIFQDDTLTPEDVWFATAEYIQTLTISERQVGNKFLTVEQVKYILTQCLVRRRVYAEVATEVGVAEDTIKGYVFRYKPRIRKYILNKFPNKCVPS